MARHHSRYIVRRRGCTEYQLRAEIAFLEHEAEQQIIARKLNAVLDIIEK